MQPKLQGSCKILETRRIAEYCRETRRLDCYSHCHGPNETIIDLSRPASTSAHQHPFLDTRESIDSPRLNAAPDLLFATQIVLTATAAAHISK